MPFERVVVDKVAKVFGSTRALAGVSVTFEAGTVTTLEGPNGAGKSTLLAVLATLARPSFGRVRYGSLDAREELDRIRPAIGLVAHEALVYPDLTARETLDLMARLYGLEPRGASVARALEQAALGEAADRPARTYSRGQLQRLALARAQLHAPRLLLFDEPTTGLDTSSSARVIDAIDEARRQGRIVVLVTHDRALSERVADRRVWLERGQVVDGPAPSRPTEKVLADAPSVK